MDVTVSPDLAGRIGETAGLLASQAAGQLGERERPADGDRGRGEARSGSARPPPLP